MTTRWTPSPSRPARRNPFGEKSLQRSALQVAPSTRKPEERWTADDLLDGTEVEIGSDVWRIDGSLLLWSGQWAFRLTALDGTVAHGPARLLVPAEAPPQDGPAPVWTFIQQGNRSPLSSDRVRLRA